MRGTLGQQIFVPFCITVVQTLHFIISLVWLPSQATNFPLWGNLTPASQNFPLICLFDEVGMIPSPPTSLPSNTLKHLLGEWWQQQSNSPAPIMTFSTLALLLTLYDIYYIVITKMWKISQQLRADVNLSQ